MRAGRRLRPMLQRAAHIDSSTSEFSMWHPLADAIGDCAASIGDGRTLPVRGLRYLVSRAASLSRLAQRELDFGEVIAFLIVMIGLISFASTGL